MVGKNAPYVQVEHGTDQVIEEPGMDKENCDQNSGMGLHQHVLVKSIQTDQEEKTTQIT